MIIVLPESTLYSTDVLGTRAYLPIPGDLAALNRSSVPMVFVGFFFGGGGGGERGQNWGAVRVEGGNARPPSHVE